MGKICPRCAERVKAAAQVCRYCGHEFVLIDADGVDRSASGEVTSGRTIWPKAAYVAVAVAVVAIVALIGYALSPQVDKPRQYAVAKRSRPDIVSAATEGTAAVETPDRSVIRTGEQLDWTAVSADAETTRQVGPLTITITRKIEDDMVSPVVAVTWGSQKVTMVGEAVSPSYTHRIDAVANRAGAPAVVMLQSFSGGAHCCVHVQVAGVSNGNLKVIDLGSWDGSEIGSPTDLSGDGLADFVFNDNAFLYAFAPYAMSYSPPSIFNLTGGRAVDVSRRAAFRRLYVAEMQRAGLTCRTAEAGVDRNGACPSYVASAARVGRLEVAWSDMLRSYAPDEQWDLPEGCAVQTKGECPQTARIVYDSYPDALLSFLKEHGYVDRGWLPPEANAQATGDEPAAADL